MVLAITLCIIGACLIFLYRHLLKQSKSPSGLIGGVMMKLWNKTYLPLVKWSLADFQAVNVNKILDVGIGNGISTNYLKNKFSSSQVWGIDISEEGIKQAKKRLDKERVTFEVKDIAKTFYEDNSFDLICAFQTHFHWDDLEMSLSKIQRMLTVDGNLIIACEASKIGYFLPDLKSKEEFRDYLSKLNLSLINTKQTNGWICYNIQRF